MFDNQRYITRGVESSIPIWLQNLLWYMIDSSEAEEKDYLQVFKLSNENGKQKIIHTQEQPTYEKEFTFDSSESITAKIFVIDDRTHSTMLLAEEY